MVIRILTLIAAMCFASTAQALVSWSIPASACVPDGLTIQGSRHFVQAPSVQHTGSNKDLIVPNCPIAPFSSGATQWNLSLTYRDTKQWAFGWGAAAASGLLVGGNSGAKNEALTPHHRGHDVARRGLSNWTFGLRYLSRPAPLQHDGSRRYGWLPRRAE